MAYDTYDNYLHGLLNRTRSTGLYDLIIFVDFDAFAWSFPSPLDILTLKQFDVHKPYTDFYERKIVIFFPSSSNISLGYTEEPYLSS